VHLCGVSWYTVVTAGRAWPYLSREWHEVVFAQREDLDVLDNDKLVVVLVEDGAVHNLAQVLLVTLGEEEEGFRIAVGRVAEALAVGILANALENGAYGAGQLRQPLLLLLVRRFLPFAGAFALPMLAVNGGVLAASRPTRPAQAVKVDGGVLGEGALGPARVQRCLRNSTLVEALYIQLAAGRVLLPLLVASVGIRTCRPLGEVAVWTVKVDRLPAAVRRLYGGVEVVPLSPVAGFGRDAERGVAIGKMGGNRFRSEGRRIHGGAL
jgi:hypothetical protein